MHYQVECCCRTTETQDSIVPKYQTCEMRLTFAEQCWYLVSNSPSVHRYLYSCLAGDNTAASSIVECDHCIRLVDLGDLSELSADLRHFAIGRPGMSDVFLAAAQAVIKDSWTAEDDCQDGMHCPNQSRPAATSRAGWVTARPKFSTTLSISCWIYRCCLSVGCFGWPRFNRTYT